MKEIFSVRDTLANKISYYHLLVFMAALPFDRFYSELVLCSLLLHELIHLNRQKISRIRLPMMMTGLLYLLIIVGAIYSSDKVQAFRDLQKQLALLLFPFIFSVTSLDIRKYGDQLLKAFMLTCIVTVLYLYFDALRIIFYNGLPLSSLVSASFINHNFSLPIQQNATYFSLYVSLAAAYSLHKLANAGGNLLLYAVSLIILTAAIFQLSSKSVFIATLIIINIIFPFLILKRKARWKFMVTSFAVSFLVIAGITQIPSFKNRYIASSKEDLTQVSIKNEVLEPRVVRWHYALQLVRKSPLVGYGTGSEKMLLKETYFKNRLFNSYLHGLDVHNQYLSFLLKTGVIGLFIYILVLYTALKRAGLSLDLVFCAFVAIAAIVSFSENLLDGNKGIFFFSFFYCFFMGMNLGRGEEANDDPTTNFSGESPLLNTA